MTAPDMPPAAPVTRQRTSKLAIASLVLSLTVCLPVIGPLLAIIFGVIALRAIKTRPLELSGGGLAIAGITISTMILAATVALTALCVRTYRRVNPVVDNFLTSLDAGDYTAAMRDFHPKLEDALPRSNLAEIGSLVRERLGHLERRAWGFTFQWRKNPGEPTSLIVVYRCRYDRTENTVWITAVFVREDGRDKLIGIWLRAPELDAARQRKSAET
jgi:hypothetical protein